MHSLKDYTLARRSFIKRCAASAFGLTCLPFLTTPASAAAVDTPLGAGFGKAKRVIFLFIGGGLTHIDTFDPKTGPSKGPGGIVATKAGDQFGSWLGKTARVADKMTVIRSMSAKIGTHREASYFMRTAYKESSTIQHPMLGAYAQAKLGKSHEVLPSTVSVCRDAGYGNGFLPASMSPLPILDPEAGLQYIKPTGELADLQASLDQLNQLDEPFREHYPDRNVKAYTDFYDDAIRLMGGKDGEAFDLSKEPKEVREAYGLTKFGQGCLLARRLVESGVRFVEVQFGGWDFHKNLVQGLEEQAPILDHVYSTLITDLDQRGMLDDTLVVLTSEFGRTPTIKSGGRNHHPAAFSAALVGAGTRAGYIHGATDELGKSVAEKPVTPGDLHATIGWAMGIDLKQPLISPTGRPIPVGGHQAKVVTDVFA